MEMALQSWCIILCGGEFNIWPCDGFNRYIATEKKTNSDYTCELVTNGISLYMRMFSQIFWFFSQHTSGTVNDLKRKVLVQCRLRVNLIDGTSYILINYPTTIVCSIHLARSQPSRFAPLWRRSTHTRTACVQTSSFSHFVWDFLVGVSYFLFWCLFQIFIFPRCLSNGDLQARHRAFLWNLG